MQNGNRGATRMTGRRTHIHTNGQADRQTGPQADEQATSEFNNHNIDNTSDNMHGP